MLIELKWVMSSSRNSCYLRIGDLVIASIFPEKENIAWYYGALHMNDGSCNILDEKFSTVEEAKNWVEKHLERITFDC